jgi:hypothetical protein
MRARAPRSLLVSALVASHLVLTTVAHAQVSEEDPDQARARTLAREAAALLSTSSYAEALAKAEAAERLYHAPFHLAVMGEALEGLGRRAEAMAAYERLAVEPIPPGASAVAIEKQARARERLRALQARVPSLLVVVRGADPAAVTAKLDGQPLVLQSGAARRLDPGSHRVEVQAAGFRTFQRTIDLPPRGGVVVMEAVLEPGHGAGPDAPPSTEAPDAGDRMSPVPEYAAFGIGGAGLLVGVISGAMFLDRWSTLSDRCPDDRCDPGAQPDLDAAHTLATVSTVGFTIAAAGAVTGVVLHLVRGSAKTETQTTGLTFGPAGVAGRF